jgi:hypothetical protein
MDEVCIKENGSTEVGHYINLKLGGWLDEVQFVDHIEMASKGKRELVQVCCWCSMVQCLDVCLLRGWKE